MKINKLLAQTEDGRTLDILTLDKEMRLAIAEFIVECDGEADGQQDEPEPKMAKIIPFGEPRR